MKIGNHHPLQIVVTGNNGPPFFPPGFVWSDELVGIGPLLDSFFAFFYLLVLFDLIV